MAPEARPDALTGPAADPAALPGRRAQNSGLRDQLLRWLLVPLTVVLVLDAGISYWAANRFAQDAHDRALDEIAREIGVLVHTDSQGQVRLELPESARRVLLEDAQDRVVFELTDAVGRRVAGDAVPAPGRGDGSQRPTAEVRGAWLYDSTLDGVPVRVVQRTLPQAGGAVVRVAETRGQRDALAQRIVLSVLMPQVVLILLAALVVRVGVDRGLRPLDALRRDMAARSHRDRRPLDEATVPSELRPLVVSMNRLIQRLDEVLTLQSRFMADAAHQLKTPVAGLQAQAQLLARQATPQQQAIIGHLVVGTERMSRLVSQLLSLARNEPEAARLLAFQPVDLSRLALDAAMAWVPQALRRDIDLGFDGPEDPVMVHGDPARLRELLDNLIDNAVRYSHAGGRATVRVRAQPRPVVSVSDDGPVIGPADRERVFERFHRLGSGGDGSGLGLAIAREIARLHGSDIVLDEDAADGVGNVFSVSFAPLGDLPDTPQGPAGPR